MVNLKPLDILDKRPSMSVFVDRLRSVDISNETTRNLLGSFNIFKRDTAVETKSDTFYETISSCVCGFYSFLYIVFLTKLNIKFQHNVFAQNVIFFGRERWK